MSRTRTSHAALLPCTLDTSSKKEGPCVTRSAFTPNQASTSLFFLKAIVLLFVSFWMMICEDDNSATNIAAIVVAAVATATAGHSSNGLTMVMMMIIVYLAGQTFSRLVSTHDDGGDDKRDTTFTRQTRKVDPAFTRSRPQYQFHNPHS
mmetsp:Transcript_13712/g.26556  ORF Transcript_13712/g.26556 Transcript_13712/m.26556 type:complete len:149 (+) Transcript_13712:947-1393(+)